MPYVYLNHKPVAASDAAIPVSDRGLRFGDGVFETLRVHGGVPYRFEWHLARLKKGLAAIKIPFDTGSLQSECAELLKLNHQTEGLLRIQVTRGTGGSGYLPKECIPNCIIETMPLPAIPDKPVSLFLSGYRRIPESSLPTGSKLCQGLNSTLARMEAAEQGCFEALQLNQQGMICEGSSSNIFWLKHNALYTPALDCGVLEGATRDVIIGQSPYKVHEVQADIDALKQADNVCVCNAAWGVVAVQSLKPEGLSWDSASFATELQHKYSEHITAYTKANCQLWQRT